MKLAEELSTFDGMSIARAVLEYVADTKTLGAKALFATHYHELTDLKIVWTVSKIIILPLRKTVMILHFTQDYPWISRR